MRYLVMALLLAGCTPTPYSAATVASKKTEQELVNMLKVGSVLIPQYQTRRTLTALDYSTCRVSRATYASAAVGKTVVCRWEDR